MQSGSAANPSFRPDINALRALAVLAVIAFHFGVPGAAAGYLGVDIFFVISGFLIGGQIQSRIAAGRFSLGGFFAGRIRRIVPALAFLCFAVLAWGWWFQLPGDYKNLARSVQSSAFFTSNVSFARQLGYFDLGAAYKPLLHTWSLAVEAQFYLLLPFFLLGLRRVRAGARAFLVLAVALASFGAALYLGREGSPAVFFSFWARAWEFLAGCAAAWFTVDKAPWPRLPPRARAALRGTAWTALIAACFLLPAGVAWPGPWTAVPVLLTAALIVLGIGQRFGPAIDNAPVQHLGTISYSLYLWHWPLLVCWRLVAMEDAAQGPAIWALLAATWLLGWASWRFVEQPMRRRPALHPDRRAFQGYAAVLAGLVVFGAVVSRTDGLPQRLPAYLQGAHVAALHDQKLDGCRQLPGAPAREDPYACELGPVKAVAPTFAVWGDSHALRYMDALRRSLDGTARSGLLFHRPGCEPAPAGRSGHAACDVHNREVARVIAANPSVRTIVIAIRHKDPPRVDHAWDAAQELLAAGYRVVFLGPLPEAGRALAQDWAAAQMRGRRAIDEVTIAREQPTQVESFDARRQHWHERAEPLAAKYPGRLVALDLSELFCDPKRCWLVRGGVGLLRDTDHLTDAGVELVLPRLAREITPAARSPA
jgi:peptidoglycan/LPS O-acetylase OafA/YrhL